jgi:rhamnosyl/mannosyltransferase
MISESDLPSYYQAADVFCLPAVSPAEAFGIVQVEAMASGRPVVSTDLVSGVSFVNRHNESGLIVPPNNVEALAAALNLLLSDEALREKLGRQAQDRAFREFSLNAMGQRTFEIYNTLVG